MSEILLERPADGVALLRLNRPEALNALSNDLRSRLAGEIRVLDEDPAIKAIVITGGAKAFAAGADLVELRDRKVHDAAFRASRVAWEAIDACRKPIIAAVNGYALGGGCELALRCDIVVAGEGASFGLPEVKVGIMPGAGGTQRLLRVAGRYAAARYLLTGDHFSAATALSLGLVSEVVPDDEVVSHAVKLGTKIAALPQLAIEAIKEVIIYGADAPLTVAQILERKSFQLLFATEDRTEGVTAFLEKRKPQFKGR